MCCFYEAKTIRINKANLTKETAGSINIDLIREAHFGMQCPICKGNGYLLCRNCEEGSIRFLGGLQECGHCKGAGLKRCFVCQSRGIIQKSVTQSSAFAVDGNE